MHRTTRRMTTTLLLLAAILVGQTAVAAAAAPRPNIIVVLADDMGFSELGCYGGEIRTPTIDRLAAEGVRFSQFYNCSVCGPSRAALMTGCQPWRVGQPPGADIFAPLATNCATLMELLAANGYETCAVGRLDMVTAENWHDPAAVGRCATRFLGSASGGPGDYFREVAKTPWFQDGRRFKRPEGAYSTDLITDFAARFIEGSATSETPFFAYISHYAPHWPLQAKEEDVAACLDLYRGRGVPALMQARLERLIDSGLLSPNTRLCPSLLRPADDVASRDHPLERMAINAAMVESIDRSLARILTALEKAGKRENTLILVLSDNGASSQLAFDSPVPPGARPGGPGTFLNHGAALASLANTPFRGHKTEFLEGGIASPLIAWWPAGLRRGGRISHRISHIADIMPTCLELAGVPHPEQFRGRRLIRPDGESLVPILGDEAASADADRVVAFAGGLRQGRFKLIETAGAPPELYDMAEDRGETTNLAERFPDRVQAMQDLLKQLGP
ncbi:MAG: Arylsulfatase [Planctomycetota bacterium]